MKALFKDDTILAIVAIVGIAVVGTFLFLGFMTKDLFPRVLRGEVLAAVVRRGR